LFCSLSCLCTLRRCLPVPAPTVFLAARLFLAWFASKLDAVAELVTVQGTIRIREVDGAMITRDAVAVAVQRRRTGAAFVDGFGTTRFVVERFHDWLTSHRRT